MPETEPRNGPPPQVIFLIRHAEKPDSTAANGVDVTGAPNPDCLTPRGWQRATGLATLFDTSVATTHPNLAVPGHLYSPAYPGGSVNHRTYETLLPLSQRLGLTIATPYPKGREAQLAASILATDAGVSLVSWEHHHIPDIAANIPVATGVTVPMVWPGDRYDIIWCFSRAAGDGCAYEFTALAEMLLEGDAPA